MPKELRDCVFDAAAPLDVARPLGERGGSGLGLSIAYRIAQDHDGTVVLEESAQGGLAAKVCLPASVT